MYPPQPSKADLWLIDAADGAGRRWMIWFPTYAGAALELAAQLKCDVMDAQIRPSRAEQAAHF